MLDRLRLDAKRIEGIVEGVRQVADLQDPIGQVVRGYTNLDGLKIVQKRVPLGVIAMIFESRPNVTIDAFSLCFKTGNSVLLRGGSDAIYSNMVLVEIIKEICCQQKLLTEQLNCYLTQVMLKQKKCPSVPSSPFLSVHLPDFFC